MSEINLSHDVYKWKATGPVTVLKPEHDYEGVNLPVAASNNGIAKLPEPSLRDPAIFINDDWTLLRYSVAGENGIAGANLYFGTGS